MRRLLSLLARTFVCGPIVMTLSACVSLGPQDEGALNSRAKSATIKASTELPHAFQTAPVGLDQSMQLTVPSRLLMVAQVVRPRAELRSGPGVQFSLEDVLLTEGAKVLIAARLGVWSKVIVLETGFKAWVHHRTLAPASKLPATITIPDHYLPTVLAVHEVSKAASFPELNPLVVTIPKGRLFRALMHRDAQTLVWLPETNSVLWVSRKDVQ